jgi:hypothetical protein
VPEWELVNETETTWTRRMVVPGGWIYASYASSVGYAMAFVPDQERENKAPREPMSG